MSASALRLTGGPWSGRDRAFLAACLGVDAVVVILAWFLAAGRAEPGDQLVFVSLALAGAVVGIYGELAWVAQGRRRVGQRTRHLLGAAPTDNVDVASAETLVAGGDRHWFHRSDCLLAASRDWPAASRHTHEAAGRRPCAACRP